MAAAPRRISQAAITTITSTMNTGVSRAIQRQGARPSPNQRPETSQTHTATQGVMPTAWATISRHGCSASQGTRHSMGSIRAPRTPPPTMTVIQ